MDNLSPTVNTREIDLTNIIPAGASRSGAMCGYFPSGPVGVPTLISSEKELRDKFGYPSKVETKSFVADSASSGLQNKVYVLDPNTNRWHKNGDTINGEYFIYNSGWKFVTPLGTYNETGSSVNTSDPTDTTDYYNSTFSTTISFTFSGVFTGNTDLYKSHYRAAANFLKYSSSLWVTRIGGEFTRNATGNFANVSISSIDELEPVKSSITVAYRHPGFYDEKVSLVSIKRNLILDLLAPQIKDKIGVYNIDESKGEIVVLIIKTPVGADPSFDPANPLYNINNLLEYYIDVGLTPSYRNSMGQPANAETVINANSKYLWVGTASIDYLNPGDHVVVGSNVLDFDITSIDNGVTDYETIIFFLTPSNGFDVVSETPADILNGINLLGELDVPYIFTTDDFDNTAQYANRLAEVAGANGKTAFASPPIESLKIDARQGNTDQQLVWAGNVNSSSYIVLDAALLKQYDPISDSDYLTSGAAHLAGLTARMDMPWSSPGGYTRGRLLGVKELLNSPNKTVRDILYQNRINPIVFEPGEGVVLIGDKTGQTKPSAFDRINVRLLFNILKKNIQRFASYTLFEINDEFTRKLFKNSLESYLNSVQGQRGLTDFYVVCDESNNNGEIIDRNEFVADIYIKPSRSINYITLNFIATRTGVSFNEIIGL